MVSIIVPIYNVYDYIYQCLESIEKQTYKHLDVVMINDGATNFVEVGPGNVLQGLMRKIDRNVATEKAAI